MYFSASPMAGTGQKRAPAAVCCMIVKAMYTQRLEKYPGLCAVFLVAVFALMPTRGFSEGLEPLGSWIGLEAITILRVDIIDPSNETIRWFGTGGVTVKKPDGTVLGVIDSSGSIAPAEGVAGAYFVELFEDQPPNGVWDLTVETDSVGSTGRVWSAQWNLLQDSFNESVALEASLYAAVAGGSPGETTVIEMMLKGYVGFRFSVTASSASGLGRIKSVPIGDASPLAARYPIYLWRPVEADYSTSEPSLENIQLTGAGPGGNGVFPGGQALEFSFETDVEGAWLLVCDINDDGVFDPTGEDDHSEIGLAEPGSISIDWDGLVNSEMSAAPGTYACRLKVLTGLLAFESNDVETSFDGMRMFHVQSNGFRQESCMYWNDVAVQGKAVEMPDGQTGRESSGPGGICSGEYSDQPDVNVNTRSWGNFSATPPQGKGEDSLLRTLAWLNEIVSEDLEVVVFQAEQIFADGFEGE